MEVSETAPAKINLALHVTGRLPDGYHELESLAVFSPGAGDRLHFSGADQDKLEIVGPFAGSVPADDHNLVCRARDGLRRVHPGHDCPPVAIRLEKNLPVASGLGGGSSDAAAALRGLSRLWRLADGGGIARLAEELGADVPMCRAAVPLIARGRGERIEPLPDFPQLALVLANPGVHLSTPAVFSALVQRENPPLPPLPASFERPALLAWLKEARNDLELPASALAPEIHEVLAELEASGAELARMSGSGATCWGLYASPAAAADAALALAAAHPPWFIRGTIAEPLAHAA